MRFEIHREYLTETFRRLAETPSPVGYYLELNPLLEKLAEELSLTVTYDRRHTAYITLDGQDNSRTVVVGAHADTLGLSVRGVDSDGMLLVRKLGGVNMAGIEGESVRVHTRSGKTYTGLAVCSSHSVHAFPDCHTLVRDEETMRVLLDEAAGSREEVRALGIRNGDVISMDPHVEVTGNGYLKSRFIDDKGAVACVFASLKALREQGLKPKYRTVFVFPYYEEVSLGGAYLPPEAEEYVALDIGLIGPELDGRERAVSICARDAKIPYDYELTGRLIEKAERLGLDYAVDAYLRYGSDAAVAVRAGNNVSHALFGMAVYCSHGRERTHLDGLDATCRLLLAYLLDL